MIDRNTNIAEHVTHTTVTETHAKKQHTTVKAI